MFRRAIVATVLMTLLCGVSARSARAARPADDAAAVSNAWLQMLDDHNYAECWKELSPSARSTVTKATFESEYKDIIGRKGPVLSRKLKNARRVPPAHAIVHYRTAWEKRKLSNEVVSLKLDQDGQWRVSGYMITPINAPSRSDTGAAR